MSASALKASGNMSCTKSMTAVVSILSLCNVTRKFNFVLLIQLLSVNTNKLRNDPQGEESNSRTPH